MSLSDYAENALLNTMRNVSASFANVYVQLHNGVTGENGTTNAANGSTRVVASFATPSAGSMATNADLTWASVAQTETYSYASLWDAASNGNCLFTGPLTTPKAVTVGDDFTIPSGSLTVSLE